MIRVFIGYDHVEEVAYHTLCSSIMRYSSEPVSITPLMKHQLIHLVNRPREPEQSNEFTFTRWLVPYLCDYEGFAIFMDCDMLLRSDIAELWAMRDNNYAVQCVKHNHVAAESTKFLNQMQTAYGKKNWSSVMIFNNDKCRALTPGYVNVVPRLKLHQFGWLFDRENCIGELPREWNHLVNVEEHNPNAKNVHFTLGGPYFNETSDCPFSEEWMSEFLYSTHCEQIS